MLDPGSVVMIAVRNIARGGGRGQSRAEPREKDQRTTPPQSVIARMESASVEASRGERPLRSSPRVEGRPFAEPRCPEARGVRRGGLDI